MVMPEDRTTPGRCNYCGAEGTVCADKGCGGYLQMGFEG
jgi:hypothetical protein